MKDFCWCQTVSVPKLPSHHVKASWTFLKSNGFESSVWSWGGSLDWPRHKPCDKSFNNHKPFQQENTTVSKLVTVGPTNLEPERIAGWYLPKKSLVNEKQAYMDNYGYIYIWNMYIQSFNIPTFGCFFRCFRA